MLLSQKVQAAVKAKGGWLEAIKVAESCLAHIEVIIHSSGAFFWYCIQDVHCCLLIHPLF